MRSTINIWTLTKYLTFSKDILTLKSVRFQKNNV